MGESKIANLGAKLWILLGIPVIAALGSVMHFVYEWSGKSAIVGIFATINESVWEHLKLAFWPALIWWLLGYFLFKEHNTRFASRWFYSCAVSELAIPLVIMMLFYTLKGAFGIESLAVSIIIFVVAVAIGQLLGLHIFKRARITLFNFVLALVILIVLAAAFGVSPFYAPDLPLFQVP